MSEAKFECDQVVDLVVKKRVVGSAYRVTDRREFHDDGESWWVYTVVSGGKKYHYNEHHLRPHDAISQLGMIIQ